MIELMIISSLVLLISITTSKIFYKFGVPTLLVFIGLGMLFGSDGIVGINFTNYEFAKDISSFALVIIMFYGGFGTNWKMTKSSSIPAILMSTLGVLITSGLTGLFAHIILGTSLLEGLLIGSVVASTDAASVFAVLRSQKLNLKGKISGLLELESGSNDPFAYLSSLAVLFLMDNKGVSALLPMVFKQIIFGLIVGSLLAKFTILCVRRLKFEVKGFYPIFILAIAMLSYSLSEYLGGNGYLSAYMSGLIIGNSSKLTYKDRRPLFDFFECNSWIMQIGLFFMLGLLSFPSKLLSVASISLAISTFMILIARPLTTFIILYPFKYSFKEKIFISWVGLRGAASIVFAIYATTYSVDMQYDIYHIVFFVALLSVGIQGTLLPKVAKKLDLIDDNELIFKTFNDYAGDIDRELVEVYVGDDSKLINKCIADADISEGILILMINRNGEAIVPKGATIIEKGDILIMAGDNLDSTFSI